MKKCPKCHGDGVAKSGRECPACNGEGKVSEQRLKELQRILKSVYKTNKERKSSWAIV